MPTPSMTCTRAPIAPAAIVLLLHSGCSGHAPPQTPTAPPRPPFAVVDSATPSNEVLQRYIRSISFVTDHVSSDMRMLDAEHAHVLIRVQPAADNYLINATLLREAGRVVARVVNPGPAPIPRFGVEPRGTTYLWIQYVGERWNGVLIATDSLGNVRGRFPVALAPDTSDHPPRSTQSMARFYTDPMTAMVVAQCNPSCSPFGWCRADSLHTATWSVQKESVRP